MFCRTQTRCFSFQHKTLLREKQREVTERARSIQPTQKFVRKHLCFFPFIHLFTVGIPSFTTPGCRRAAQNLTIEKAWILNSTVNAIIIGLNPFVLETRIVTLWSWGTMEPYTRRNRCGSRRRKGWDGVRERKIISGKVPLVHPLAAAMQRTSATAHRCPKSAEFKIKRACFDRQVCACIRGQDPTTDGIKWLPLGVHILHAHEAFRTLITFKQSFLNDYSAEVCQVQPNSVWQVE